MLCRGSFSVAQGHLSDINEPDTNNCSTASRNKSSRSICDL